MISKNPFLSHQNQFPSTDFFSQTDNADSGFSWLVSWWTRFNFNFTNDTCEDFGKIVFLRNTSSSIRRILFLSTFSLTKICHINQNNKCGAA